MIIHSDFADCRYNSIFIKQIESNQSGCYNQGNKWDWQKYGKKGMSINEI